MLQERSERCLHEEGKLHLSVIVYFLFWTCMPEIKFYPYFSPNAQHKILKTDLILVYEHIDIS